MDKINFIAEVGVNHEGNLKSAFSHIIAAKKGGADTVKFQVYKAEKIVSRYAKSYWDKKKIKKQVNLSYSKNLMH